MVQASLYKVTGDTVLTPDFLNSLLGDIDTRMRAVEAIRASLASAVSDLQAVGLARINDTVAPLIQQAQHDVAEVQSKLALMAAQIGDLLGGVVPADSVAENATRVFVTPAQRAAIGDIAALVASLPTKAASNDATLTGLLAIAGALKFASSISPASLFADGHDFAPADFATTSRVRLSSTAARAITGLVAAEDGRVVLLENVAGFDITLKAESELSAAGNRFAFYADVVLPKNGGVATLIYDAGLARWLLAGGGKLSDLQIGDTLETTVNPGVRFLKTDGSLYLNTSYPALRALLGPYQNPLVSRLAVGVDSTPRLYRLNGLWLASVYSGGAWLLMSSPDLVTWTARTAPSGATSGQSMCYGAGLYVWTDGLSIIRTSPDLAVWTTRALPSGLESLNYIVAGATKFVGLGSKPGGAPAVIHSANGIAWILSTSAFGSNLYSAAYNPAGACWITGGASGRIHRSTDDGVTWVDLGPQVVGNVFWAASGGGKFAVATGNGGQAYISADGVTWTPASAAFTAVAGSLTAQSISHDGEAFVMSFGSSPVLARSADFVAWTFQNAAGVTGPITNVLRSGTTVNDAYVIVATGGIFSGLDLSTTQFQVPTIAGRASNTNVYIKAL